MSCFKIYLAFYHFSLPPLLAPFHKYPHFLSGLLQKPDFPTSALTFGTFTHIHACTCVPEWFVTKQNQIMLLNCSNSSPTAFILVMTWGPALCLLWFLWPYLTLLQWLFQSCSSHAAIFASPRHAPDSEPVPWLCSAYKTPPQNIYVALFLTSFWSLLRNCGLKKDFSDHSV